MSYIQSKYYTWYQELVEKAKDRNWSKETAPCYTEIHHIVPRSLRGTDNLDNLVTLTAREHYIAHRLLAKFTTGDAKIKMNMALFCMITLNYSKSVIQNKSKLYEKIKNEYAEMVKGKNHFNYGLTRSEETKGLIRQKRALQVMPKEIYKLRSEKVKGQVWMNDGKKSYRILPDKIEEAKQKGYVFGRITNYITEEYKNNSKNTATRMWQNIKNAGYKNPKEYIGEIKLAT